MLARPGNILGIGTTEHELYAERAVGMDGPYRAVEQRRRISQSGPSLWVFKQLGAKDYVYRGQCPGPDIQTRRIDRHTVLITNRDAATDIYTYKHRDADTDSNRLRDEQDL